MEDERIKEFGIINVRQEAESNEKFFIVDVMYRGIHTDAAPHLPFRLQITSLDELRSLLTALGVNNYVSNLDTRNGTFEISPCTVSDFIECLAKNNDQSVTHIAEDTSEGEFKNRLKQWQKNTNQKHRSQVLNQ